MERELRELFAATLDAFERRLADEVARADPPLDETELSKASEILRNTAAMRERLVGKAELAN